MTTIFESAETYTLEDFDMGHQRLLIRRPKGQTHDDNMDIIFEGVRYINIPTLMRGIVIRKGSGESLEERQHIKDYLVPGSHLYRIALQQSECYIIASCMGIYTNSFEFYETSLGNEYATRGELLLEA